MHELHSISQSQGYWLLGIFGFAMIFLTVWKSQGHLWQTQVGFLAAGRKVSWVVGSLSIAVSWIWAPALFVSVQQAYQQGIPGIFWFTFPNVLCLFIMAPLAKRIREQLPNGYTQPEWIRLRLGEKTHKLYLIPFFWYQLMAVVVQLYAGGNFISLLTGIPLQTVMCILALIVLAYSLISGMRASILTDYLQYVLIIIGGFIILPWTLHIAGGWSAIFPGLGGITGQHRSLFDPMVAFNFGIISSINLISGMLSDQQHWQRAFVIPKKDLPKAYLLGGFLFGIVPLGLSLLGFLAANPALRIALPTGIDPAMIGIAAIAKFLPPVAILIFVVMLLSSLCATLDSGLCAAGSLYAIDLYRYNDEEKTLLNQEESQKPLTKQEQNVRVTLDKKMLTRSRFAMTAITLIGLAISFAILYIPNFGLKYLWWLMNSVSVGFAMPTVLSLTWKRLDAKGAFWGILLSIIIGIPTFIYGNIVGNVGITVLGCVGTLLISTVVCFLFPRASP